MMNKKIHFGDIIELTNLLNVRDKKGRKMQNDLQVVGFGN